MKIKNLFLKLLKEQENEMDSISVEDDQVMEFPNSNFVVSVFKDEKKLLFSPQNHQSLTNKIRTFVNLIKQNFRVLGVSAKSGGAFELQLDPREDIDSTVDFIKREIDSDSNI